MSTQSKSPAINVLLVGMDEKKAAVFRMAFKMHAAVRYAIIDAGSGETPQLAIVDVDGIEGMQAWHGFVQEYPDLPGILSSLSEPDFAVPYLAKPVKIENLFPLIRAVMKGEGVFNPVAKQQERAAAEMVRQEKVQAESKKKKDTPEDQQFVVRKFQRKEQLPTAGIALFDAEAGLLGALREACRQDKDVALVYQSKPLLVVFPSIQKILLAVPPEDLRSVCEDDAAQVEMKYIADNPAWRRNAKVSFESCLWQFAVWTGQGRLVAAITPDTLMRLKGWPNLTRLAHISDAMRLSAFMTQTTANLHILYKILRVELIDLLNFVSATYMVGLLTTDAQTIQSLAASQTAHADEKVQGNGLQEDGIVVRQKYKAQSTGMLQRLMSRLAVKE
ncbi:MAG: response regulator [Neisseria sp.]|nr:response regulator [Neisseria sp.]